MLERSVFEEIKTGLSRLSKMVVNVKGPAEAGGKGGEAAMQPLARVILPGLRPQSG